MIGRWEADYNIKTFAFEHTHKDEEIDVVDLIRGKSNKSVPKPIVRDNRFTALCFKMELQDGEYCIYANGI